MNIIGGQYGPRRQDEYGGPNRRCNGDGESVRGAENHDGQCCTEERHSVEQNEPPLHSI